MFLRCQAFWASDTSFYATYHYCNWEATSDYWAFRRPVINIGGTFAIFAPIYAQRRVRLSDRGPIIVGSSSRLTTGRPGQLRPDWPSAGPSQVIRHET